MLLVLKISLVAALFAGPLGVRAADVYVSFDEAGIAHFASHVVDDSYRLLIKDLSPLAPEQSPRPAATPGSMGEIRSALEAVAERHGLEYDLLHAIAQAESGFDTMAVSTKGAIGIMQLMPATAQRYGVQAANAAELRMKLHQLSVNVDVGGRYLSDLMRQFGGKTELVLAAYNAGEGAVRRAGNQIPNYPETRKYVERVMRTLGNIRSQEVQKPTRVDRSMQGVVVVRGGREPSEGAAQGVQLFRGGQVEFKKFEQGFDLAPVLRTPS